MENKKRSEQYFPELPEPVEFSEEALKDPLNKALEVANRLGQQIASQGVFSNPETNEELHKIGRL